MKSLAIIKSQLRTVDLQHFKDRPVKKPILKIQLLAILTSQNFARLSILTSEMDPENFRSVSQTLSISQKNM